MTAVNASETGQNPTLPQELIDHALGYVDTTSLKQVSLASHTLLDSARRYLFYSILATTHQQRRGRSIVDLQRCIACSPWAMHSHRIRCLHVSGATPFPALISVLSALPSLHTFILRAAEVLDIPDPLPFPSIPTRAMDTVGIHSVSYRTTAGSIRPSSEMEFYFLHLFSSISNVRISSYLSSRDEEAMTPWNPPIPCPSKTSIMSFSLGWGLYDNVTTVCAHAAALLQSFDVASATSLEMPGWPPNCAIGYSPLCLAASHTLTDLTITMLTPLSDIHHESQQSSPQFWSQLGLSSCHALRTIQFTLSIRRTQALARMWRHIFDILSTVLTSSLTKIAFQSDPTSTPGTKSDDFPWDVLEFELIRCCRDAAQVVFILVEGLTAEEEASFRYAVLSKLPQVNEKYVVLFDRFKIG